MLSAALLCPPARGSEHDRSEAPSSGGITAVATRFADQPAEQPAAEAEPPAPPPAPVAAVREVPPRILPFEPLPQPTILPYYRRSRFRLASVPNLFGDLYGLGNQVLFNKAGLNGANGMADLPLAGGLRRAKISENNKALPMDRVYFTYNHFHNALAAQNDPTQELPGDGRPTGTIIDSSIDRYVLGFEKTFLDECWSVDVRMPFSDGYSFDQTGLGFGVFGNEIGNLNVAVKRLLCGGEYCALTAGLGIDVPTGGDVQGIAQGESFRVRNDAVHLQPFLGCVGAPNDRFFYHGFAQLDIDANGNRIGQDSLEFGVLQDQTLLLLDASAGVWAYRNPCACVLTGLAGLVEFHYTTTLQDTDRVNAGDVFNPPNPSVFLTNLLFYNRGNRVDLANLTIGLHAELAGQTTLRVGAAFPIGEEDNRGFDSEVLIQLNRYF